VNPATNPSEFSKTKQALGFVGWFVLCFATSAIGALASANAGSFYKTLVRPTWSPPGWLFGPVWTLLFLCMAIAAWLVWRSRADARAKVAALGLFVAQLAANALWSWLFFAWRMGSAAFIDIVMLWVLIACTIAMFWRISKTAGLLLVPYLSWVTFAGALNWVLWRANLGILG
jgi:translocator protein